MDTSDDIATDLSPLEQRRMRLRAFADRVLEAVEALPMPKTHLDSERILRAITAADRMLVQIYSRVTPSQQQPISPSVSRAASMPASLRTALQPEIEPETEDNAPFVYRYDDDDVDEALEDAPDEEAEPLSPDARAALDLEQRANEIYAEYLRAIAKNPDDPIRQNTGSP